MYCWSQNDDATVGALAMPEDCPKGRRGGGCFTEILVVTQGGGCVADTLQYCDEFVSPAVNGGSGQP